MRNFVRIAALAAALAAAAPAAAQQQAAHPSQARVGIGLGMNVEQISPAFTGIFTAPQIYVPIALAPNFRIEPQFGWTSIDDDADDTTDRWFTLGVGGFYVVPTLQQTQLYVGGRLAFTWVRDETRVTPAVLRETTQRNTTLAAVLGGEYLPSPRFSVGAEGQLGYTWVGDPESKQAGVTTTGQGGSVKSTQGILFIRVYFL